MTTFAPRDAAATDSDDGGADQATDQGMRRTRRDPEKPGEDVPQNAAHQTRENHDEELRAVDLIDVDDALADGCRDFDREKRTCQVQQRG